MPDVDWNRLRTWKNSKNSAFEALCCQLAESEAVPSNSTFFRKGAPDSGVECYWRLPNGDEWGWQAKFFTSQPTGNQWQQIDRSVRKALSGHPRLRQYFICLPFDPPDPRKGLKTFQKAWQQHQKKWDGWARTHKMKVNFVFWGEHRLLERLSKEEHRGRRAFWFNETLFSQSSLTASLASVIANAGARYTPEVHVELPIAKLFDGLGRTERFFSDLRTRRGKVRKELQSARSLFSREPLHSLLDDTEQSVEALLAQLSTFPDDHTTPLPLEDTTSLLERALASTTECKAQLYTLEITPEMETAWNQHSSDRPSGSYQPTLKDQSRYAQDHVHSLGTALSQLRGLLNGSATQLANNPALLVAGAAGRGKTHLLCDIAAKRLQDGRPTILALGESFNQEDPWGQLIRMQGLTCDLNEFLGSLEAAAQASNSRALILIDALNEGEGKVLWSKHLAGMLSLLKRRPWIGIALTVRTSYERLVVPSSVDAKQLVRTEHYGFADHEYQATKTFFAYYGIAQPTVPLLVPEFQNPLFLSIFCKAVANSGLKQLPKGIQGITALYEFFLTSVEEKLSKPERLDFDPQTRPVHKAVNLMLERMLTKVTSWLPREDTKSLINPLVATTGGYESTFFRNLVSEGILAEDCFYDSAGNPTEGVRFSYERFSDHLTATFLLEKHLATKSPTASFAKDAPLGSLLKDAHTAASHGGLIEALSIQVPERVGRELVELAPHAQRFTTVVNAFVDSIPWRNPTAFGDGTSSFINSVVSRHEDTFYSFLNAMLTIAPVPEHPYNAERLHRLLSRYKMPDRDAWWGPYLYRMYGDHSAIDRLVDWALLIKDAKSYDPRATFLAAVALSWLLASSNRFLRDRATKALVSLLTGRLDILASLLDAFKDVDDVYVLERLYAVAYGSAMRSPKDTHLGPLANKIYDRVFNAAEVPPHILLRDYARGVIELALHLQTPGLTVNPERILPPYKSTWPPRLATDAEKALFSKWDKDLPRKDTAGHTIYSSLWSMGDFGRYELGGDSGHLPNWSSRRLDSSEPSLREVLETFAAKLNRLEKSAWQSYVSERRELDYCRKATPEERKRRYKKTLTDKELTQLAAQLEAALLKALTPKHRVLFRKAVKPYITSTVSEDEAERLPVETVRRAILAKILDLGWTAKRFGEFDDMVDRLGHRQYMRAGRKPERIGKKYQWIGLCELLGRVSDNCAMKWDSWEKSRQRYKGPWQLSRRDIDPSCLVLLPEKDSLTPARHPLWDHIAYNQWKPSESFRKWIARTSDVLNPTSLLSVEDSIGESWLSLDGSFRWEQPVSADLDEDRYDHRRRNLSMWIESVIVRRKDADQFCKWVSKNPQVYEWIRPRNPLLDVFLGEFYWSPAYKDINHECGCSRWKRFGRSPTSPEALLTTCGYGFQCDHDGSDNHESSFTLPSASLVEGMGLSMGMGGEVLDGKGQVISFDPITQSTGQSGLIVRRKPFLEFLEKHKYELIWIVSGEKTVLGGDMSEWVGRQYFSGAYRLVSGNCLGRLRHTIIDGRRSKKQVRPKPNAYLTKLAKSMTHIARSRSSLLELALNPEGPTDIENE